MTSRSNAPNWSEDRMMKQNPDFTNASADSPNPVYFTGEMVKDSISVLFLYRTLIPRSRYSRICSMTTTSSTISKKRPRFLQQTTDPNSTTKLSWQGTRFQYTQPRTWSTCTSISTSPGIQLRRSTIAIISLLMFFTMTLWLTRRMS